MKTLKIMAAVSVAALMGCQTMPTNSSGASDVSYSGESNAGPTLRADTTKMIKMLVQGKGCANIEHINTKVLQYEPSNGTKGHVWGKEGWMVSGCGKPFPFLVSFTEDGNGGTFFGITPVQR